MIEFTVLKKHQKAESGITGIFHQFKNFDGTISFEYPISDSEKNKVFEFSQDTPVKHVSNFIASYVNRIAPDTYYKVLLEDGTSVLISSFGDDDKLSVKLFQYYDFIFDEKLLSQKIATENQGVVSLQELLSDKLVDLDVPQEGSYTKNPIINNILKDNFVPVDVDRDFIKTLSHVLYRILESLKENKKESEVFTIYKNPKKGFKIGENSISNKKINNQISLTVKQSHFN